MATTCARPTPLPAMMPALTRRTSNAFASTPLSDVERVAHERDGREHGLAGALLDLVEVVDRAVELVADPGQQHAGEQADEDAEHDVEREPRRDRRGAGGGRRGELHRGRLAAAVGERERDLLGQLRAAAAQRRDLVVELSGGRRVADALLGDELADAAR